MQCILPVVLEHVKVQLVLFKRDMLQELRREAALCASMKVQDCSEEIRRLQDNMQQQTDLINRQLESTVRQAVESCVIREMRRQQTREQERQ